MGNQSNHSEVRTHDEFILGVNFVNLLCRFLLEEQQKIDGNFGTLAGFLALFWMVYRLAQKERESLQLKGRRVYNDRVPGNFDGENLLQPPQPHKKARKNK
jgi:hypothetical protein